MYENRVAISQPPSPHESLFASLMKFLNTLIRSMAPDFLMYGRLFDTTIGLNWYLNSYAKIQFNYIRADLDRGNFTDSRADIYGIRGQFDF